MASGKLLAGGGGAPLMANSLPAPQSKILVARLLTLQRQIPSAPTIEHRPVLLRALTEPAEHCISIEDTQTDTEILAFLLCQADLEGARFDRADELFADLASRICPRVMLDTSEFAADLNLATMIECLRDFYSPDHN